MVTRLERMNDFICGGSAYVVPFLCRWRDEWQHAKTNRRIEATVIGWRVSNKAQR